MNTRFYDPQQMAQIADLYESLAYKIREFEGEYAVSRSSDSPNPLYIYSLEVVVRHANDYTVGRLFIEDGTLIFELTDEDYGVEPTATEVPRDDSVAAAIQAHVRQEDTASGQR